MENIADIGVPLPDFLMRAVRYVKQRAEGKMGENGLDGSAMDGGEGDE